VIPISPKIYNTLTKTVRKNDILLYYYKIKVKKTEKMKDKNLKSTVLTFYTEVSGWDTKNFISQLKEADHNGAESITILINSAGGNCIDGISVFAAIRKCKAKVKCVIDGIAASMASVIWAAGDELYMRDYALLMIHNPFAGYDHQEDEQTERMVESFKHQLITIYTRRFAFTREKAQRIMDGNDGADGTFFTAEDAVKEGFLPAENIIPTPSILRAGIAATLMMEKDKTTAAKTIQPLLDDSLEERISETNQHIINQITSAMETETLQQINDRLTKEAGELKAQLAEQQTKLAGSQQTVKNLQAQLKEATAKINDYEMQQAVQKQKEIEQIVDQAINECRIDKNAREAWIEMAKLNTELVTTIFASIPAVSDIAKEIATDKENIEKAKAALESKEDIENKTIEQLVGKDFKFKSISNR